MSSTRIVPCLWLDDQAEEAANFYCSIFKNSRIVRVTRYGKAGHEIHRRPEGSVMTVDFELDGQPFTVLNGGPMFQLNEAISLQVMCDDQAELDHYWARLGEGGDENARQCGWLKDKYGLSWQVVPKALNELVNESDPQKSDRVIEALLKMNKLDIAKLKEASAG